MHAGVQTYDGVVFQVGSDDVARKAIFQFMSVFGAVSAHVISGGIPTIQVQGMYELTYH